MIEEDDQRIFMSGDDVDHRGGEDFQGSNVDLGFTYAEVDDDLRCRSHQIDAVLATYRDAHKGVTERKRELRLAMAKALTTRSKGTASATLAKAQAESDCAEQLFALESEVALRDYCSDELASRRSQLSAAQTRANMWQAQFDLENRRR